MNKEFIFDEAKREEFLSRYTEKNKDAVVTVIGRSILGRDIHCYKIGTGERVITLVGSHSGRERVSVATLYGLIEFFDEKSTRGGTFCDVNIGILLQLFTFMIIPCPNPDGVEMCAAGISKTPLYERQMRMNGGSEDSFAWEANARGVDLNHNYGARFLEYKGAFEREEGISAGAVGFSGEYPESEPESHGIANLLRTVAPCAVLCLRDGGGVISAPSGEERCVRIAARLADAVGYRRECPPVRESYGSLSEYAGAALMIPSFSVRLSVGERSTLISLCDTVRRLSVCLCKFV